MYTVLLSPGVSPTAVNKYINISKTFKTLLLRQTLTASSLYLLDISSNLGRNTNAILLPYKQFALQLNLEEADLRSFRVVWVSTIISFYDTSAINEQLAAPFATAISNMLKTKRLRN